jgi:hypothetical protein
MAWIVTPCAARLHTNSNTAREESEYSLLLKFYNNRIVDVDGTVCWPTVFNHITLHLVASKIYENTIFSKEPTRTHHRNHSATIGGSIRYFSATGTADAKCISQDSIINGTKSRGYTLHTSLVKQKPTPTPRYRRLQTNVRPACNAGVCGSDRSCDLFEVLSTVIGTCCEI